MKVLELLLGNNSKNQAVGELEAALRAAETELTQANEALTKARAAYAASLRNPDATVSMRARQDVTASEVAVDRARALIELANERLSAEQNREASAQRRVRYDEAKRLAAGARAALKGYPSLARQMVDLLETVAKAEAAVTATNKELPAGAKPLPSPEQEARGRPADAEEIVDQHESFVWYYVNTNSPVEPDYVNSIKSNDGRSGSFEVTKRGLRQGYDAVCRRQVEKQIRPGRGAAFATPLSYGITLPSFHSGAPDYWRPLPLRSAEFEDPRIVNEATIAAIDAGRHQWTAPPPADPRSARTPEARVALVEIEDAAREAAE